MQPIPTGRLTLRFLLTTVLLVVFVVLAACGGGGDILNPDPDDEFDFDATGLVAFVSDRFISFVSDRSGDLDVWVVEFNGEGLTNVTNHPADELASSWYDDRTLVGGSDRNGNRDLFSADIDGGAVVQLTSDPGDDEVPKAQP